MTQRCDLCYSDYTKHIVFFGVTDSQPLGNTFVCDSCFRRYDFESLDPEFSNVISAECFREGVARFKEALQVKESR
jgi:hypothetical protein